MLGGAEINMDAMEGSAVANMVEMLENYLTAGTGGG